MTLRPSDAVMDLLRQGKRDQALELYGQQGANSWDISRLSTAAKMASDRGISIEDALAYVVGKLDEPVAQSEHGPGPLLGCLSGLCFLFAVIAFLWNSVINRPCPRGVESPSYFCGYHWSSGEIVTIALAAAFGGLLLLAFVRARKHRG
jgi:hypothetical protein